MAKATITPERKVSSPTEPKAIGRPSVSAMIPAESAPSAYPRSRQNR
jgi:hypothetical protein